MKQGESHFCARIIMHMLNMHMLNMHIIPIIMLLAVNLRI